MVGSRCRNGCSARCNATRGVTITSHIDVQVKPEALPFAGIGMKDFLPQAQQQVRARAHLLVSLPDAVQIMQRQAQLQQAAAMQHNAARQDQQRPSMPMHSQGGGGGRS